MTNVRSLQGIDIDGRQREECGQNPGDARAHEIARCARMKGILVLGIEAQLPEDIADADRLGLNLDGNDLPEPLFVRGFPEDEHREMLRDVPQFFLISLAYI